MGLSRLAITGARWSRYEYLYCALRQQIPAVDVIETGLLRTWEHLLSAALSFYPRREKWAERRWKNAFAFARRSLRAEADVLGVQPSPDLVLHIHSMFCPSWRQHSIRFAFYLDYTMALTLEQYLPWSNFVFGFERDAWLRAERSAYHRANRIFTMSRMVKESVVGFYGVPDQKVVVVGASGHFPKPWDGTRAPTRGGTMLFVSSEFLRKGGDVLFRAFREMRRRRPDLKLLIAGEEPPVVLPGGASYVGLLPGPDAMRELYLQADLVVLPSFCDPFPLTLIEALNYGVPCVATQVCGIPEIVEDGVSGLLVQPGNPDQLAEACLRILGDTALWRGMSEAGREKIRQSLNWDSVARKMVTAMTESVGNVETDQAAT